MPLYSDTSLYSQTVPSYALYLSSPYSGHSSLIGSYSRPTFSKPLPRFHRNFAPHLATISENQVTSLRRKYSPQLRISAPKYSVPRPIKINTADIDVSANKYKHHNVTKTPEKEVVKHEEVKPIRRDRATVRLHTLHSGNKDKKWRQNFNSFELNTDHTKNKPEEENPPEEVQLPKSPSFHDICRAISTDSINEELNPGQPIEVVRKQSRTFSSDDLLKHIRRNSAEILKENVEALDQLLSEDINNNNSESKRSAKADDTFESRGSVRKRKKITKRKSKDLKTEIDECNTVQPTPTIPQPEVENPPTQSPLQRRNTKKASFKDISKVEVEEIRKKPKPLFTATVDIEESKPNLKLIVDDVKVEESPKQRPKKFKFNVTVEVEEKPKLKKKVDDKGKMYIPNSKPALVTAIKKKEQRGSLGDICEGIEEMPKRKKQENQDEQIKMMEETDQSNSEIKTDTEQNNLGRIIGEEKQTIEGNKMKIESNSDMNEVNEGIINKQIGEIDKKQEIHKAVNTLTDNKDRVEMVKKGELDGINNDVKENQQKSAVLNTTNNQSSKTAKTSEGIEKQKVLQENKSANKINENDEKPIKDEQLFNSKLKEEISLKSRFDEKSKLADLNKKDEVKPSLKWNQKFNNDGSKENAALKMRQNDDNLKNLKNEGKNLSAGKEDNNKSLFTIKQNQKQNNSDSLKENSKPGIGARFPKILETKEEKVIPKWKLDLKKAQQNKEGKKEGIKSIMKSNQQDGNRNYKKSVSIEEQKQEDNDMDFWETIGSRSSVYERKPIELKSLPFSGFKKEQSEEEGEESQTLESQQVEEESQKDVIEKSDEVLENEESKDDVSPLKLVSKRSLVNKATNEDPDLQVFVPPQKPPTPEPQPESFVPLQSNRLSQWMHPFKKPEQFDECPVEIYATPKNIRRRHFPKPRHPVAQESDSEETSSEDESSEEDGNIGKSTSSNDSGFNSSNGCGRNRKDKDCDVNIHRKCEKLTANLCGINQKLIVEAIESVKKGSSDTRDSPTSNPAHNPAFALDPCDSVEEFQMSSTYASFQKSGRITPPATTIPRFRKYTIDDFNFLKVLGKGSFGKVLLAELKETEYYYAIKCLKKDVVLEDDDVECTLIERKVLALGTKHPYLCHLLCTFQTESHLFFVMEYLNGGDLMFHIQQSGRFPEPRARFYGAEIVSGLKFLHNKGIVYRDLKLDNVLLDFDGHVRIADFGMCKLQIFLDRMADTFCGTPDYMAPEIIKGQHYNQCVDWWSFGVLLYEMLIGQSPFSGCDEDELFWSICNEKPVFPRFLSGEANSVLTQLLEKDWNKRLGNKLSPHGDIQDHAFFRPIAWDLLEMRHLEAPFKPNLQHPLDTQYFDKTFTVEKAKLTPIEKNILQSMDQTQFQGFSYTNPNATDR